MIVPVFGGEIHRNCFNVAEKIAGMREERFSEHILHRFRVFGSVCPQI
ncbi:MAG: hypothetical protein IJ334_12015 [Clostridia bacterium]|nr:hypothetical protein [Clostridia bacterium]